MDGGVKEQSRHARTVWAGAAKWGGHGRSSLLVSSEASRCCTRAGVVRDAAETHISGSRINGLGAHAFDVVAIEVAAGKPGVSVVCVCVCVYVCRVCGKIKSPRESIYSNRVFTFLCRRAEDNNIITASFARNRLLSLFGSYDCLSFILLVCLPAASNQHYEPTNHYLLTIATHRLSLWYRLIARYRPSKHDSSACWLSVVLSLAEDRRCLSPARIGYVSSSSNICRAPPTVKHGMLMQSPSKISHSLYH